MTQGTVSQPKAILVVDDEPSVTELIHSALSGKYHVDTAHNGKQAQLLLAESRYDLVITDLVMPEMNGIDLIMHIDKCFPGVQVMAISGGGGINGRFDYLLVAKLLTAGKILRKPFTLSEIRKEVAEVLSA